ncbi:MAG TPA: hypothetical protein VHH88_08825, partial [Verrucomicrobiae bacterium]|nr:hypothetical protein [Verrucomicrobiae bacterium]
WAGACLKNPDDLLKGASALPLDAINDAAPEGKQLLSSAREILANLGKREAASISIEDTTDTARIFSQTRFNGDGIIPADSAEDEATRSTIADIIACLGGETDRSAKPGVNQAKVDQFFAEAQAYSDWWKKAEDDPAVLPLDGTTERAAGSLKAVSGKIEDFFTRCRLAAFDPRAIPALNREEKEYALIGAKDLTANSSEIANLPLAQVGPGKSLPLGEGLNPAWSATIAQFHEVAVRPFLNGKKELSEQDWSVVRAKFAPYDAWHATKAGAAVEKLGVKRAREILSNGARERIQALLEKDKALEPEASAIAAVDRLVRYHRDLFKLVNNFVSFRDFYRRKEKAIFQAGTLYLDQRSCDLCLTVEDPARHALLAGLAGTYLAYCDCTRKSSGEKMQILAAFTDGDSDNLMVGRNGIFYDRRGQDWDATITKIVDNPISIRQAFWSPYKKFVRMLEEQIAKRASAADAAASNRLATAAAGVATADVPAAKPLEPKKFDVGVVAALGVAVGAIGGALASLATGLMRLQTWQIPLVFVGIILLISLPSMVIAWLKLRKRNLGPILDANGWAVNARARMNVPFGRSLTRVAALPAGSKRDLTDPFADESNPWPTIILILVIAALAAAWLRKTETGRRWTQAHFGRKPAAAVTNAPIAPNPAPTTGAGAK